MPAIADKQLTQLREHSDAFMRRWKKAGRPITKYRCLHCRKEIERTRPTKADVGSRGCWSSATTCYHCGGLMFVLVFVSGKVEVEKIG